MTLVPRIMELLADQEVDEVRVLVGGTIPPEDTEALKALGVAEVFGPGASTEGIVEFLHSSVAAAA
jgi:methylmalonyl-CoA mutase C-terminal domain/subunit